MSASKRKTAAEHLFLYWKEKNKDLDSPVGSEEQKNQQTPAASFVAPVIKLKNMKCEKKQELKQKSL